MDGSIHAISIHLIFVERVSCSSFVLYTIYLLTSWNQIHTVNLSDSKRYPCKFGIRFGQMIATSSDILQYYYSFLRVCLDREYVYSWIWVIFGSVKGELLWFTRPHHICKIDIYDLSTWHWSVLGFTIIGCSISLMNCFSVGWTSDIQLGNICFWFVPPRHHLCDAGIFATSKVNSKGIPDEVSICELFSFQGTLF